MLHAIKELRSDPRFPSGTSFALYDMAAGVPVRPWEYPQREKEMKENVGPVDRTMRSVFGPALVIAALTRLGARRGRTAGLAAMAAGLLITESAITKVCPVNAALGIDTP